MVQITETSGLDALNANAVATIAGTSSRPIRDRFTSRSAMMVTLWEEIALATFRNLLLPIADSLLTRDSAQLAILLQRIGEQTSEHACLRELLLVTAHEGDVARLVRSEVLQYVTRGDLIMTTQRVIALMFAVGLVVAAEPIATSDLENGPMGDVLMAITHPTEPTELPDYRAEYMELQYFATGDQTTDALLNTALREIVANGYRATSILRICDAAGVSEGAAFARYSTKLDLLIDIIERRLREAMSINFRSHNELVSQIGAELAEAVKWREYFRPEHQGAIRFAMEIERLSLTNRKLADSFAVARSSFSRDYLESLPATESAYAVESVALGLALASGLQALAIVYPEGVALPYDIFTMYVSEQMPVSST